MGRLLFVAMLFFMTAGLVSAQAEAGLYQAADPLFTYTGAWVEVIDGDYVVMESNTAADSASFEFDGSAIILYRELFAASGATFEVCIDDECATITSSATADMRHIPVSYNTTGADPHTLTLENIDGGLFRLEYVIVIPPDDLNMLQSPNPSIQYFQLGSRVVGVDFVITGGDIALIILLAFLSVVLLCLVLIVRWQHG